MLSANEWSRFITDRKGLRTSNPQGAQLSTYWLSIPLTHGIFLGASSFTLHWVVSQAIFQSQRLTLVPNGEMSFSNTHNGVGYSINATLAALLICTFMLLVLLLNSARKLQPCILVGIIVWRLLRLVTGKKGMSWHIWEK